MPDVGNFDDILAQARQQGGAPLAGTAAAGNEAATEGASAGAAAGEAASPAAGGEGSPVAAADAAAAEKEEEEDLLILGSDEEGEEGVEGAGARLVELPSTTKKKRRMPFITQVRPGAGGLGGWLAVL